jgi:hypothetical protein
VSSPDPNVIAILTVLFHDFIILLLVLVGFVMDKVARGEISISRQYRSASAPYPSSICHTFYYRQYKEISLLNVVLCCIVLYCVVLYCIVLYCVVLCCIVLCCVVVCCVVLCCVVQNCKSTETVNTAFI